MAFLSRFRSKRRDIETDVARLLPILNSAQTAVREAESELGGLIVRLRESRDNAAFLVGTGMESEADTDPRLKARLDDIEAFLARGGLRKGYLTRQVAILRQVVAILTATVRPDTPAADKH